jgi:D-glycero-alpha-D-manno-heptose-7-phosphate kinase
MIIARSPLRISLGGGGTDLSSYYGLHGGFLIAGAIDKYVYITIHETFVEDLIIKYSEMERVPGRDQVRHPIIRETLKLLDIRQNNLEITSMADIPAGTGLGSSGSFTTALLRALHMLRKDIVTPLDLAEEACHVEIDLLGEPIGKQDQYIAAVGGLTCFEFAKDGAVTASPLQMEEEARYSLEDNLLLFFTGYSRSASGILKDQNEKSKVKDSDMIANLDFIKDLGRQSKAALERSDLAGFARLMDVHWQHKKRRTQGMSNSNIDTWYQLAMANGAQGGKLIGAGGGGFLMFYSEDKLRLRHAMRQAGLREVRFKFDFEGTKVLAS